jgi:tripartite-type tricarboxylate transporter receptor subunit TctC
MKRRDLLSLGPAATLACLFPVRMAGAQEKYPSRVVRLIVPTPAGGVYDLVGRWFLDRIGRSLGTVIVENRAGGNATIGVTAAARSEPDGYTLLLGSNSTHIFQPAMMSAPPYDPVRQFASISSLAASWSCIAVSPKLPVRTLGELISYARGNPGKVTYGMRGVGDVSHMAAELLKKLTGISLQAIPYSAMAQAVNDLMSGDLAMSVPLLTRNLVDLHEVEKIRLLAVNAPRRLPSARDIPTAIEAGIADMTAGEFFYLFAPSGTPVAILQQLNGLVGAALADEGFRAKLAGAGFDPVFAGGLNETRALFNAERARWLPIAEATGMKIN